MEKTGYHSTMGASRNPLILNGFNQRGLLLNKRLNPEQ
jgi:hypothetical protein